MSDPSDKDDAPPPEAPPPIRRESSRQRAERAIAGSGAVIEELKDGGVLAAIPMLVRVASGTAIDCEGGCGFFAVSGVNSNLCSKCYKQRCDQSTVAVVPPTPPSAAPAPAVHEPPVAPPAPVASAEPAAPAVGVASAAPVAPAAPEASSEPAKPAVQTNTSRCWTCNRKIGLTGFQCKCEYFFCAQHRYSDRHDCPFDFKTAGKAQLSAANPVIAPAKLTSL